MSARQWNSPLTLQDYFLIHLPLYDLFFLIVSPHSPITFLMIHPLEPFFFSLVSRVRFCWACFFRPITPILISEKFRCQAFFRSREQPGEVYSSFLKHFTGSLYLNCYSSQDFRKCFLNDSAIVVFSGNFPLKFPYHLTPFRKFRKFWSNGKRPQFILMGTIDLSALTAISRT